MLSDGTEQCVLLRNQSEEMQNISLTLTQFAKWESNPKPITLYYNFMDNFLLDIVYILFHNLMTNLRTTVSNLIRKK